MNKLEQHAVIHNRFDVIVQDAKTGKVKQTAVAYNMILNRWFYCLTMSGGISWECYHLQYISFGTGSGTLDVTRTSMFSQLALKSASVIDTVYDNPTSYVTKEIRLEAEEYNGNTITEVGFQDSYSVNRYLVTHAFLKDSEGNQIAISKTDSDVVIIRGTFYVTFTHGGFGTYGIYAPESENLVVSCIFGENNLPMTAAFSRYTSDTPSQMDKRNQGRKTTSLSSCTRDTTNWSMDYPVFTWSDTECVNHTVKQIGMAGFAAINLPDSSIFTPIAISHLSVGTGDGSTTEFDIGTPLLEPDSETIYVDGVAKTRGTDYTVDPTNNMVDMRENYWSAELDALSDNVEFGNLKTRSMSSSSYYDPIAWWSCTNPNHYPYSCTISSDTPIWIDFGEAKECNRMKFELITVPSAQIDNMVIEYSSDNINWTAVSTTRSEQVWSFPLTSARYWRVYIPSYSWSYSLQLSPSTVRDSHTYGTTFFLGKVTSGLTFVTAPAAGAAIEASFTLNYPYKTENNLLKFTASLVFTRGEGS